MSQSDMTINYKSRKPFGFKGIEKGGLATNK